jgi:glucose-1-phosphate adenylyltransferase
VRSRVQAGATIRDSLVMGQDYYDSPERAPAPDAPTMGIGHGASIERTIVDKNARIGDDVRISPAGKPEFFDGPNYYIRDGIVIIPKNAVIRNGTVI